MRDGMNSNELLASLFWNHGRRQHLFCHCILDAVMAVLKSYAQTWNFLHGMQYMLSLLVSFLSLSRFLGRCMRNSRIHQLATVLSSVVYWVKQQLSCHEMACEHKGELTVDWSLIRCSVWGPNADESTVLSAASVSFMWHPQFLVLSWNPIDLRLLYASIAYFSYSFRDLRKRVSEILDKSFYRCRLKHTVLLLFCCDMIY